jgi:hypothetical protein
MCPELKVGKSLIGAEYRGKSFYIKVNADALITSFPGQRHLRLHKRICLKCGAFYAKANAKALDISAREYIV